MGDFNLQNNFVMFKPEGFNAGKQIIIILMSSHIDLSTEPDGKQFST